MVHSMTAFARHEQATAHGTLSWELRSVNHRYLEPHLRLPEAFRDLEGAVREALRAGRLIEVLPGYRAEPLSLSLVYPQRRELSRRVNLFMQWLAGVMKEHLD